MTPVNRIPSAPDTVALMITRRCNLHCLHCSASPEQFVRDDMSTQELLSTIDQLAACKVFRVVITGGEPLLHPDFFTIAGAVVGHPLRLQLNTNATLVTEKVVDRLQQWRRGFLISVSLDGITAETHDRIRGPGSFRRVTRGIKMLAGAGFLVRPFVVLSGLNCHELPQIMDFARALGISSVNVAPPTACGRAPRYTQEMKFGPEQLRSALEVFWRVENHSPGMITGPWRNLARFYRDLEEGQVRQPVPGEVRLFTNCGGAWKQASIAVDGTVAPCEMAFTCRAGNVRDQPFAEIWRNSPVFRMIRGRRGMPLREVHGCENCLWHAACEGPCPAGGYAATGIWPAAEPVCMTREIGKLVEMESVTQSEGKGL